MQIQQLKNIFFELFYTMISIPPKPDSSPPETYSKQKRYRPKSKSPYSVNDFSIKPVPIF